MSRGAVGGIAGGITIFFLAIGVLAFYLLLPKAKSAVNTASGNLQGEYPKDRAVEHGGRLSQSAKTVDVSSDLMQN